MDKKNNNLIMPSTIDIEKGCANNGYSCDTNLDKNCNVSTNCETSGDGKKILNNNFDEKNLFLNKKSVVCRVALYTVCLFTTIIIITLLWLYMGWMYGVPAIFVAIIAILVASRGWHWFYIAFVTTPRDVKALFAYAKLLIMVKRLQKRNATLGDIFAEYVAKTPDKKCFIYENESWTFKEVNEYSNRVANLFHLHGYKKGDVIGLLLENRPEFIGMWLGLSKLGIVVPLINTNLRQASLTHSINVANCHAIIYGENFLESIEEIVESLPSTINYYQLNDKINLNVKQTSKDLATLLLTVSKDEITNKIDKPSHHDNLLYIYTSGTTGLPKAAVITHSRYVFIAAGIHYIGGFKQSDVIYTPLPLYHTAGGVMSVGQSLLFGATVVMRKKFSATNYFQDCQKYNCTIAQYIGEMCRYVLATKPSNLDAAHSLRLVFGNGLRPQIWPQFVKRFNIPKVVEFYGATEGNANIANIDNTTGAIGFVSRILPAVYPISIIRADPESGDPIRGPDGLCQLCKPNEPGVFIGKIIAGNPSRAFLGYVDKKASDKKIVQDVFKKGDSAFLSGDLLESDERGYLYFKDRTGDTFRWKGENVSTSEVEAQVSNVAGYRDTVVYGVEIPNLEGRAGMAAILDPNLEVDLVAFNDGLKKVLPTYARPQFIRLLTKVDLTGTFKLRKIDLQKDSFNPNITNDKLYYLTANGYQQLTNDIYEQINMGAIRF